MEGKRVIQPDTGEETKKRLPLAGIIAAVLAALLLGAALGFREQMFMGLIVMLGSPCTPTSYVMTRSLGGDAALAGTTVMLTTLASSVSLTFWIFLWRSLGVL